MLRIEIMVSRPFKIRILHENRSIVGLMLCFSLDLCCKLCASYLFAPVAILFIRFDSWFLLFVNAKYIVNISQYRYISACF